MRRARRVIAVLVLLLIGWVVISPTGRYLARGAWAEASILAHRRSIDAIVRDPKTPADAAAKLRLVLAARAFAADSIHLTAKKSFTTYTQLDRDTLVLVLSGAYPDRLAAYTWWFPIVGRVPYKGYFDFALAKSAEHDLAAKGFDVYLRPSPAFSTLGWFNDPLLSTSLRADTIDLANTVIHELTHNTFFASGQTVFNESFASFVGSRGSAWFYRARGDSAAADQEDARWADDKILARFWAQLYQRVDSAFRAHPRDSLARIAARDTLYAQARRELVATIGPSLKTIPAPALARVRLDNAALLAHRIYNTDLDLFDGVWTREGGDLRRAIARIIELAKARPSDPFGAIRGWIASRD